MAVLDIITMQYPAMAALPNISNWIAYAEGKTNRPYFNQNGDEAVALLAMHMYVISPASGNRPMSEAGTITSKKEGELSINFGQVSNRSYTNDSLDQSAFGKQLKALIRAQTPAIGVIGGGITINQPLPPEVLQADSIADDFLNEEGRNIAID